MTSRGAAPAPVRLFTVETAIGAASSGGKPYAPVLMQGKAIEVISCSAATSRHRR